MRDRWGRGNPSYIDLSENNIGHGFPEARIVELPGANHYIFIGK